MIYTLALDISTSTTGFSLWEDKKCILSDSVHKKNKKNDTWIDRVTYMSNYIKNITKDYEISYIVVEDAFSRLNVNTLKKLCLAQGLIIGTVSQENSKLIMVYPKTWQSYHGIANLKREMLKEFTLENAPNIIHRELTSNTDDEADSIHIGSWFVNTQLETEEMNGRD